MSADRRALLRVALDRPAAARHSRSSGATSSIARGHDPRAVAHLARGQRRRGAASPASSATRRCRARTASCRCRRARPRRRRAGCPSSSATICANVVSCPWPCVCTLIASCAVPVGDDAQRGAVVHPQPEHVHVLARAGADRLGEERDADAHQLAALALRRLLGAAARRSRRCSSASAQRALVVAGVVDPAGLRRVRELLGPEQVAQPQLDRVDRQLAAPGSRRAARPGRPPRRSGTSTRRRRRPAPCSCRRP